ncbi:NADP oxidoreductase [Desulfurivibrio dismutans]|uniref:NADH-quinone oxidoreductase subunit B family protein n=1 Tax=Desulfurivibrio dismutans TaxID=1398908 RepID=UPI0023DAA129|nr:NADP oxidoreductase [Desulfurivibrio alkaliphilus]MDF1613493.1 hypothetical protein [Desulfurivibrio alkaliphilus]
MKRLRLATIWLDGCSGCHMSFLDMDELLLELAPRLELAYSPLVDRKEFPEQVDLALLEGAVSTPEDEAKARLVRARSHLVVALGDCACNGNLPAMRNRLDNAELLDLVYRQQAEGEAGPPTRNVPPLLPHSLPLHRVIDVDLFLPGCPPPAAAIVRALTAVLEGRELSELPTLKFG